MSAETEVDTHPERKVSVSRVLLSLTKSTWLRGKEDSWRTGDRGVYTTFTTASQGCKHHESTFFSFFFPLFMLSGFCKLHQVCQLQRWTVLCVPLSPRCARRGRHTGVEVRRWDERVPAVPQKLHSRVRADWNWQWFFLLCRCLCVSSCSCKNVFRSQEGLKSLACDRRGAAEMSDEGTS